MNFKEGSLEDSEIDFMINHHFIDPKLIPNWEGACHTDPKSAGCKFFYARYEDIVKKIDPYNLYGGCLFGKTSQSQSVFSKKLAKKHSRILNGEHFWPFISP